eukprot:scaffold179457_cov26-Cyclotella_meneghiniana.AAC.2
MSDYRLVIMAEDGGGDAQYWSSPLSQRHGGSSDDVLNGGPRLETSTWHQQPHSWPGGPGPRGSPQVLGSG